MKRIVLGAAVVLGAAGVGYVKFPAEFGRAAGQVGAQAGKLAADVSGNPLPVALAAGTFLATVGYHKARGKSLRESFTVAATRVTVVPVPVPAEADAAVVRRAKARATRSQLVADQIGLENRLRALPAAVAKAEKDVCYAEQSLADAERAVADRQDAHEAASDRLADLRSERDAGQAELAAIGDELRKLTELV